MKFSRYSFLILFHALILFIVPLAASLDPEELQCLQLLAKTWPVLELPADLNTVCSSPLSVIRCDEGHVVELYLSVDPPAVLLGQLPGEAISKCIHLKTFDGTGNSFDGTIPSSITTLPNLTSLQLSVNKLQGPLPEIWSNSLTEIDLSDNLIGGTIPQSLTLLPKLRHLDIAGNLLTAHLPQFYSDSIWYFSAAFNDLYGTIPEAIGSVLSHTGASLLLGQNSLSGTIPPSLFRHDAITFLGLMDNELDLCATNVTYHQQSGVLQCNIGEQWIKTSNCSCASRFPKTCSAAFMKECMNCLNFKTSYTMDSRFQCASFKGKWFISGDVEVNAENSSPSQPFVLPADSDEIYLRDNLVVRGGSILFQRVFSSLIVLENIILDSANIKIEVGKDESSELLRITQDPNELTGSNPPSYRKTMMTAWYLTRVQPPSHINRDSIKAKIGTKSCDRFSIALVTLGQHGTTIRVGITSTPCSTIVGIAIGSTCIGLMVLTVIGFIIFYLIKKIKKRRKRDYDVEEYQEFETADEAKRLLRSVNS